MSFKELQDYCNMSESWEVPIRLTFSNCHIEEKHLGDFYCNTLADIFATGKNEIICNSPLLEKYLRDKYGDKYRYISSTTKCLKDDKKQLEETTKDEYYLVVLDLDNNKKFDLIKSLPDVSKVEVICNSPCQDNCPRKEDHYNLLSKIQMEFGGDYWKPCDYENGLLYDKQSRGHHISPDDINNVYLPLGVKHFKLEGRSLPPPEWVEDMSYYLIKEEHQLKFRQDIIRLIY